jgi:hypothetical protein
MKCIRKKPPTVIYHATGKKKNGKNEGNAKIHSLEQQHASYNHPKAFAVALGHSTKMVVDQLLEIFHKYPTYGH